MLSLLNVVGCMATWLLQYNSRAFLSEEEVCVDVKEDEREWSEADG